MPLQSHWPNGAVVYQIYPRSFYDSNADGIGDLPGVIEKLEYLQDLGVTALWLSPFYTSPMADFGYDVADYRDVDPIFGTLDDATRLIDAAHAHGLRIMVDLVPNHTSDAHAWFEASKKSCDNQYADYYIWRDPSGYDDTGSPLPPNNWVNVFAGEPAWEYNPAREQFYMHSFHVRQPDLNWENPTVRQEIQDVMRFWLDIGVDGFRVDAVNFIAKDPSFADDPINETWNLPYPGYGQLIHSFSQSGPHLHDYLSELASVLREAPYAQRDAFMVTEGYPSTPDHIKEYLAYYNGIIGDEAAPFCFEGLELPWKAGSWTEFMRHYSAGLEEIPGAIPAFAFSNHDQARPVSRHSPAIARSAAVLLLTLPGIVFMYNGDELGMRNGVIPPDRIVDPGATQSDGGRDPQRTPFQWSAERNAGFSTADTTWLPVNGDFPSVNAENEALYPTSFLSLYRILCRVRSTTPALFRGTMEVFETGNEALFGYVRRDGNDAVTVLVNFSDKEVRYTPEHYTGDILASTHSTPHLGSTLVLAPHEAIILR